MDVYETVIGVEWLRQTLIDLGVEPNCVPDDFDLEKFFRVHGKNKDLMEIVWEYLKKWDGVVEAFKIVQILPEYRKEAEEIIEKNGDVDAAFYMAKDLKSDVEWAKKIIESKKDTWYAVRLVKYCGADRHWAEKMVFDNINDKDYPGSWIDAQYLYDNCNSSFDWLISVVEKSKNIGWVNLLRLYGILNNEKCNNFCQSWL